MKLTSPFIWRLYLRQACANCLTGDSLIRFACLHVEDCCSSVCKGKRPDVMGVDVVQLSSVYLVITELTG